MPAIDVGNARRDVMPGYPPVSHVRTPTRFVSTRIRNRKMCTLAVTLSISKTSQLFNLERELRQIAGHQEKDDASQEVSSATAEEASEDRGHPNLIRLRSGGDAHFLGVSSGMNLARSALESAQQNNTSFDSAQGDDRPDAESTVDETNASAMHTSLPPKETATSLINFFFSRYQVQYPILDETEFANTVSEYYDRTAGAGHSRPQDLWTKFMLNMVFSISLNGLSQENEQCLELSKAFSVTAISDLSFLMQMKNALTMQCLLLLLLASILNIPSTPIWYLSGLCMRMCVDLGYHTERTIAISGSGSATDDEIDTKRRLFWVSFGFDRTLSILLGRPFTFDDERIDVKLPRGDLSSRRHNQILHWLHLQRLQSEIVRYSHQSQARGAQGREGAELTEWTKSLDRRLSEWNATAQGLADTDGHDMDWWGYWYHNALLTLHRPSPARPTLCNADLAFCFSAARNLIQLSFIRIHKDIMDFTWVDLHYQFMSGITLVFLIWNSVEGRREAKKDWISVKSSLFQWKFVLQRLAHRWSGIARARVALAKLADATTNLIEGELASSSGHAVHAHREANVPDVERRRSILQQFRPSEAGSLTRNNPARSFIGATDQTNTPWPASRVPENAVHQDWTRSCATATHEQRDNLPTGICNAQDQSLTPLAGGLTGQDMSVPLTPSGRGEMTPLGETTGMASILADGLLPLSGTMNDSQAPADFAFWEYFSAPMLGMDDIGLPVLNSHANFDGPFTSSILNFHDELDNGGD
ncbi:fungal-specific transcription factor domain-containing protein [Emericellopsis atlantica]|uniref:Fungal-specific transcription factor domain-containing protein n=1 Tax=Emericellopsis atlantica TaxID=2614577 RepID=A0A9P7ZI34_9HYPO|nr:fungal-specific transcription factor domain-containing protein [Emericellopsis atlantica]KAG9252514.1 fungal-specific transcription factor domain-containing protein [Emericellopsis atlantica]